MDRLNCFNAYNNKELHHEDQLTRAYLILLKYSFHTFSAFLSYVQQENINDEHKINFLGGVLKSMLTLNEAIIDVKEG